MKKMEALELLLEVQLERRERLVRSVAERSDVVEGEVCGGEILASSWCFERQARLRDTELQKTGTLVCQSIHIPIH